MMNKRGSLTYVLSRTIDIIFSGLIILLILAILFSLYRVFWAEDKTVKNQYVLAGDILQGVVENPALGRESERAFSFTFQKKGEQAFQGTLFGVSSDGNFTTPLPPINWYTRDIMDDLSVAELNRFIAGWKANGELSLTRVKSSCTQKACLCLSTKPVAGREGGEQLLEALQHIDECRAYDVPAGSDLLLFDFSSLQRLEQDNPWYLNLFGAGDSESGYDDDLYPEIRFKKGACTNDVTQRYPPGALDNAVCVYASMASETT